MSSEDPCKEIWLNELVLEQDITRMVRGESSENPRVFIAVEWYWLVKRTREIEYATLSNLRDMCDVIYHKVKWKLEVFVCLDR